MKIFFYVMGEKGYKVLYSFINQFGVESVSFVRYARDAALVNDWSDDIRRLLEDKKIQHSLDEAPADLKYDYALSIGWRWLLSEKNLIVFHDALLPRYRGFAPLVNMLIQGDDEVGVTALIATERYDEGPIIGQRSTKIDYPIKVQRAIEIVSKLYVDLVLDICRKISQGVSLLALEQSHEGATYSVWRDEDDYFVNWNKGAEEIKRFIDSVGVPFKGAATLVGDKIYRIHDAEVKADVYVESRSDHLGKVIFKDDYGPTVICGSGLLKILNMTADSSEGLVSLPFRTRFR